MDPLVISAVLTPLAAAFAGLWWYTKQTNEARIAELRQSFTEMVAEKDRQLAKQETRITTQEAKIEALTDIVGKNTDSLEESNVNSRMMIDLLRRLDRGDARAWTNSPPDPALPGPR